MSLRYNSFIDNSANSGSIVYNCGEYGDIKNNWYGTDNPDFTNKFKEWHFFGSDDNRSDSNCLVSDSLFDALNKV